MSNALLAEVGWDAGFAIPVANAENKALEEGLQKKQKEQLNLENKINKNKDVINALTEHLKNLRQEVSHTQALCKAREKETESEVHFRALAERETGRLKQEVTQLENQLKTLNEKKNAQENNIFKATQKLDELKSQLNWDQQTREGWLQESAHKDEDTMAIIKYAKQDESKIRELTLNIEKLTLEANQKRKALDSEVTETVTAQVALDKTAESFRQAHIERQEMISQWENTIEQMRKRDQEIQQCAMMQAEMNQVIREKNYLLKERKDFMEHEIENNKELERNISAAERQVLRLRQQHQEEERSQRRLQDEVEVLKGTLDRTATDVETTRSQLTSMKKDIQDKTAKVEGAKLHNAALKEKLRMVTEAVLDGEEQAAQMEQLHREQEQNIKEIDAQLLWQRELMFRKSKELQGLREKEKNTTAEICATRAAISNLDSRLSKQDQNLLKQQMIISNQDFQIQMLERKTLHLQGKVNTEEKEALEKKASDLAEALEEKKRTAATLTTQLKKLQDDIRCVRKDTEKIGTEKRELTSKIQELELFIDNSEKDQKKLRLKKQDSMVEKGLLKMEVQRLRDLLYDRADGVLSLEKRRLQLQVAMKEREEEIHVHREMLAKQAKLTEQERQGLSAAVNERLFKIDKMRKRYEILTVSMAAPEGEEEKSQAYFIIKAAQEKEELQRQGDELDAKIRKTEKEIHALENTLQVVNSCNTTYRKALTKVTESSPAHQEKLKLEEQRRAAEEKYKYKKRQIRELQEDIESMSRTLDGLLQEEAVQNETTGRTQAHVLSLNKDILSQEEKLNRAIKQCAKHTREIRSAKNTKEKTFEERDIELRELRDFNKSVNKMLLEAMEENPDLSSALQIRFMQAGLSLPSPASTPSSRLSSKISSARSSASLHRSSNPSASSSPRSQSVTSPAVKTVDLGLGLSVTSPQGSRPPSAGSSSRSSKCKSP
ncbi:coiled-coil domain-containing protein 39-like isoform X1 [Sinocyclocheilus rhinocerous]|uniref:coiled-coil domain-containing protein 39-like isoform X1 n=2 Tax=Sinocyclocheilus rhinocerous TaxID=307959 RepID=UPI0007B82660|nr:PREDICTED: coiled-coil domain-containing protein 39-like isoform X1 [Sinocyclocheilus rhinocerous]